MFRSLSDRRRATTLATMPLLALACACVPAFAAETQDRAALEKQLDDARARLDDAARDVADLTQKLHGDGPDDVIRYVHRADGGRRAMLGINIGGPQELAEGVEITGVSPSGPAQAAGLRTGDVIVAIDGKALRKTDDASPGKQLTNHLRTVEPGKPVKVDYLRDGKRLTASVTTRAAEPPMVRMLRERLPMLEGVPMPFEFEEFVGHGRTFGSLELVPMTPKLGRYFGTDKGLLVVRAPDADGARLEEGDVLLTIGGRTPEDPRHAFRILGSYQPNEKVKVEVLRQRKRLTVDLVVPEARGGALVLPAVPAPRPVPPARPAPTAPAAPATPAAPAKTATVTS
jgi:membrane-associated protease RseP (regulator of RpoE activity)